MSVAGPLSTLPNFILYFVTGAILTAVFLFLYANLTPHREIRLIREGNVAAAITLTGGLFGFVLPLASVIAHSGVIFEVVIWGAVALVVQLGGFFAARMMLPHLSQAIENGNVSDAIFLGGLSVALGVLDAACMAG